MEQYVFDGFMKERDIEIIAGKMQSYYNEMELELTVKHFYTRYQDPQKYKHLYHKETVLSRKILVLLQTHYDDLTNEEKLRILLFVAYRYRNNIFHGNKGVLSWKNYSEQIDLCLKFMMSLVECAKNHSEDIK